jgi:ribosomal-protein-alanine N-acetyltransferase
MNLHALELAGEQVNLRPCRFIFRPRLPNEAGTIGAWKSKAGDAGFVGLSHPSFEAHFTPCLENGWRRARSAWGHGDATEAARLVLEFGFAELQLGGTVSCMSVRSFPARRVMERIGVTSDAADDFDHPRMPAGHPQRPHVLNRIARGATSS